MRVRKRPGVSISEHTYTTLEACIQRRSGPVIIFIIGIAIGVCACLQYFDSSSTDLQPLSSNPTRGQTLSTYKFPLANPQILTIGNKFIDLEAKMKFTPLVLGLMAAVTVTAKDKDKKKHFKNESVFLPPLSSIPSHPLSAPHYSTPHFFHTSPNTDNHSYNGAPRNAWETATTCMVFSTSISQFSNLFSRHHAPGVADKEAAVLLDWSTDACTGVDDRPFGWDFKPSCIRHDFGYRNYKRQGRFTKVGNVLAFAFPTLLSFFDSTCISPGDRREKRWFANVCM
jgi:hypothetical protein